MDRRIALALSVLIFAAGCAHPSNAQVPPASKGSNVNLTWGLQPNTTCAGCTFAVYAETLASGAQCDAFGSASWSEITTPATRPTALAYTDSGSSGMIKCYNVEAICPTCGFNGGPANSDPSNTAGPVTVPGPPLAPAQLTPTTVVSSLVRPASKEPAMASLGPAPTNLKAIVIAR